MRNACRLSSRPSRCPGSDDKPGTVSLQPQHLCLRQGLPVSLVIDGAIDTHTDIHLVGQIDSWVSSTVEAPVEPQLIKWYRTWRGNRGEEWSSAQGLESILISIQSLMSSNPYENEPGYESTASRQDKEDMTAYAAKVKIPFHTTIHKVCADLFAFYDVDPPRKYPDLRHRTSRVPSWY